MRIGVLEMHPRISVDPKIMGGTPCIKGTRVPLYVILDNLEAGSSFEEILSDYPSLSREDIRAAIRLGSALTASLRNADSAG